MPCRGRGKKTKICVDVSEMFDSQSSSDKSDAALHRIRESFGISGPFTPLQDARDKDPELVEWWKVLVWIIIERYSESQVQYLCPCVVYVRR